MTSIALEKHLPTNSTQDNQSNVLLRHDKQCVTSHIHCSYWLFVLSSQWPLKYSSSCCHSVNDDRLVHLYKFMALQYDQILAGNCFGQINMTPPPGPTNSKLVENKDIEHNLIDQFGFSLEHLYNLARQFLRGRSSLFIEITR